jgi:hypothetical protein
MTNIYRIIWILIISLLYNVSIIINIMESDNKLIKKIGIRRETKTDEE